MKRKVKLVPQVGGPILWLFLLGALLLGLNSSPVSAAPFTAGDLVALQAAASANNTTVSVVELNPALSLQTSGVQSIAVSGTGANAIRLSSSATSTGYVATTNDRSLLTFTAANSADTTSNVNTLNPRAVVTFDANGTFAIATTYTGTSGNQTRGATSLNNTTWFIGDQGGIYTNGTSAANPSGNIRGVKSFGGTVYGLTASASAAPVFTVSAPTGGSTTSLPGLASGATSRQDFYLISSGDNGSAYDVLYVLDSSANATGTIFKYSLVSGSWTANGSYATTFGGFGLAVADSGNGALLYVTTGAGAQTANKVLKITDTAGYNATISITTANNVTLYTAPAGAILKGLDFAPASATNQAPTDITLSPNSVLENAAVGTDVGTLTTTDPDAGNTFTYSLPAGQGDNASFAIAVDKLKTATSLDFETKPTYSIMVQSTDGGGLSVTKNLTVNVTNVNEAPSGADNTVTTPEDTAYTFTAADFGFSDSNDTPANGLAAVKVTTLPGAGTLTDNGVAVAAGQIVNIAEINGGLLKFTPAANANGTNYANFLFQVKDDGGTANGGIDLDQTPNTLTINVSAVNDAPVAGDLNITTNKNTVATGSLTATDVDGNTLTFSLVANSTHGNTVVNANGSFTYTPNTDYTGSDSFTFKANDGLVDSNIATVSIIVLATANHNPIAGGQTLTTDEDIALNGTLTATDMDGDALTYSIVVNGTKGTATITNAATGAFTYTPNANANGSDSFTFKANDGIADSNIATVSLTINSINDLPVANDGTIDTNEDTAQSGTLSAGDADGDALTYSIIVNGAKGSATITNAATGAFTYTPNANANGADSFTFKANDGIADSNTATITVNIAPINDAPVAAAQTVTTDEDIALNGTVTATDVEGDALTFSKVANPTHGTATVNSNGTFTYTPVANFNGSDSFTFKANDGTADSNIATVSITVNSINDTAVATGQSVFLDLDTAKEITLSASDADGDVLTYSVVANPTHGTLGTVTANKVTYTPATGYHGTDSFSFKANDGTADSNTATVNITVLKAPGPFTAGNVVIYRVGDRSAALTNAGTAVYLDEYSPSGTLIQSIPMPTAVSGANRPLVASGTATSEGLLSLSADGHYLILSGYDAVPGTAGVAASSTSGTTPVKRVIGRVDSSGTVDTSTAISNFSANNIRSATSTDGTTLWASGGNDGVRTATLGATASPQVSGTFTNLRQLSVFDGQLYVSSGSGALRLGKVGTGTPTATGQTTTSLPGFSTSSGSPYAFFFADLDAGVAGVDTLYVADDGGTIQKYCLVGGTWTAKGTVSATAVRGLTGSVSGGNVTLYVTYGSTSNTLGALTDSSGYNANLSGSVTPVATAGANTAFRGVAVMPAAANSAPVASDGTATTDEDTAKEITLAATDVDGNPLTYSIVTGPTKGTLGAIIGDKVTYTPNANFHSSDSFTFKANDGTADSNTATVSITVTAVNDAPVASDNAASTDEDTAKEITLTATDADGDALTYSIVTGPTHGTLGTITEDKVTYTPDANFHGSDGFTFKANDGTVDSNTATIFLTVNAVNDAPVASDGSATTGEDTAKVITLTATDADGDAVTYSIVTGPTHGTLSAITEDKVTYMPEANYHGSDSFTFKANAGMVDSNEAAVSITVTAVNDAPVASNGTATTDEDTAKEISLVATDVDGNPLTYSIVTGPMHGTLGTVAGDKVIYTPNANYHGSDSFTFKANDGTVDSNTATISLTIAAVNDVPVASDGTATTGEDTAKEITLVATDADGNPLTYSVVTGPTSGTLGTITGNKVTYTPNANFHGSDSFTFKANDGTADSNTATVSITVTAVNDAPVASSQSVGVDEDSSKLVTLGASDVDGDTLSFTITVQPAHGGLTNQDGSPIVNSKPATNKVIYTPVANYPLGTMNDGSDSFKFKANDGTVDSNEATVSIIVTAVCDAPVTVGDSYSVVTGQTLNVPAPGVLGNDSELDGEALSVSSHTEPTHGTLTINANGSLIYMPDPGFIGSDSFTYKASDGFLESAATTVNITVTAEANHAPTASVVLSPINPKTKDTLTATITTGDVDGQTVTTSIVWKKNGTILTGETGATLALSHAGHGDKGDVITVEVTPNDGTLNGTPATANVTVINTAPVATAVKASVNFNTAQPITLAAGDADTDTLTYQVTVQPTKGTLSTVTGNTVTYTPGTGYSGADSFSFVAKDDSSISAAAKVTITVLTAGALPTITSFTPAAGAPGTAVKLVGTGLGNVTDVLFNGLSVGAGNFTKINGNSIVATVPPGALTGKISVTAGASTVSSLKDFIVAPRITAVTPNSGAVNDVITVTGENLGSTGTTVSINGVKATLVTGSQSATSLQVKVPATATTGALTVTNAGGTGSSASPFSVLPKVVSAVPAAGKPGDVIAINGNGFGNTSDVQFNGLSVGTGNFTVVTPIKLTAIVPAGSTTGKVKVVTAEGQAESPANFTVAPRITAVTPGSGVVNDVITITGENLGSTGTTVSISGVKATLVTGSQSATSLQVKVPALATTGALTVTNAGGTATWTSSFLVLPKVVSTAPKAGKPGDAVTINGNGFGNTSDVQFNGLSVGTGNFTVVSPIKLTAIVPAGSTTGKVKVVTAEGQAESTTPFIVAPRISAVTPNSGAVNDVITITGENLGSTGTTVNINGVKATLVTGSQSATSLLFKVPATATTGTLAVANAGGTGSSANPFNVLPKVISFTPTMGVAGTTLVSIAGTTLGSVTDIWINGQSVGGAANFTIVSAAKLTFTLPANTTSGKITVVTPSANAVSANDFFVAPRLTSVTPGSARIGQTVSVTGANLEGATVKIGSVTQTIVSSSATEVVFTVAATTKTGVLTVKAPGGTVTGATFTILP